MLSEIRWGIVGCGDVTEVKSGPALQNVEGSTVFGIMRRTADLAQDYAERHNVPFWTGEADELINHPEVNAVYVATPPSTHKEYTLKAAAANKPVYVEKPMAANYIECLDMIDACKSAGVPLFVAYYRRALPRFLKIRSLIHEGKLGKIRFVNVTYHEKPREKDLKGEKHWRVDPAIAGAGYFYDLASHMLDFLQYCLGDIDAAYGFKATQRQLYAAEDMVSGVFKFPDEVFGTGIWNFTAYKDMDRTEIIGEKGKITYSTFDASPVRFESGEGLQKIDFPNPKHIQQPLIEQVVLDIQGKGKCRSTGRTGARTNWVMDSILGKI